MLLLSVAKLQEPALGSSDSYLAFRSIEGWQNMFIGMLLEQLWVHLVNSVSLFHNLGLEQLPFQLARYAANAAPPSPLLRHSISLTSLPADLVGLHAVLHELQKNVPDYRECGKSLALN